MPSNFTQDIRDGKPMGLADFIQTCAQALISSPEQSEAITSYEKQLEEARAEIARVQGWDDIEADHQAQLAYARENKEYHLALSRCALVRKRCETLLAEVKAWAPPPAERSNQLKDFMIQQLESVLDNDCDTDMSPPVRRSGAEYRLMRLCAAQNKVTHYDTRVAAIRNRTDADAKWLKALQRSATGSSEPLVGT